MVGGLGALPSWSVTSTFSVTPLVAPTLIGPTGSAGITPTLQWDAVPLAAGYEVRVKDLTTGRTRGIVASAGTSWTAATSLVAGHRYRWWVRAVSASGARGVWSTPLDFTVA